MRVLVTGAQGQLGRALVAAAPPEVELITADRATLDLADRAAVSAGVARLAPDVLINAAAYTAVDRAETEPATAHAVNATAVEAMAKALAASGGRLVQVSTDFVFGGDVSRAYRPGDERHPTSIYGASKAAGEDAAGPNAMVVRTSWLHGATGANFVRTMLRLMRERGEVRVVADQIGAPTWTGSLAQVIWRMVTLDQPGIWHWSDAGVATWYDFAVAIGEEAEARGLLGSLARVIPIASAEFSTPARRPHFSLLDSSATRAALDLDAVHWRENLRAMLDEMRSRSSTS